MRYGKKMLTYLLAASIAATSACALSACGEKAENGTGEALPGEPQTGESGGVEEMSNKNETLEVAGHFTVNPGITYQTWEGFGTSSCWWSQYVGGWDEAAGDIEIPVREQIAKWLYDPEEGIGLTIYRYNVGAGSADSGKGDISDKNRRAQSFLAEDGSYDWDKDENAVWFMKRCAELGAEDVVFFCNSPIEQVTTNGKALMDEGSTSNLDPEYYQAFADYVFDVAEHFRDEGVPVTMISPINEPQWEWTSGQEGCHYTPEAVRDVLKVFVRTLQERGLNEAVEITSPESGEWGGDATKAYVDVIMQDEELGKYFTKMDIHSYWSDKIKKQLFMQWKDSRYPDLQLVMSEWCEMVNGVDYTMDSAFNMADTIYEDMTICNVLSWQYWVGVADGDYRDGLIYVDKSTKTAKPNRRLWEFGNYARYIKPGYTRVDITTEDDDLKLLKPVAFTGTDENGKEVLVMVLINRGDVRKFSLQGLAGDYTSFDVHTTTDKMDLEETASGELGDLSAQVFEIEGRSISTVVLRK